VQKTFFLFDRNFWEFLTALGFFELFEFQLEFENFYLKRRKTNNRNKELTKELTKN